MPTYRVTDPLSGKTLKLTGDSPPTEIELRKIFSSQNQPIEEQPTAAQADDGTGPEWAGRYPNLYGVYGAGRELLRTGIETAGQTAGAVGLDLDVVFVVVLAGGGVEGEEHEQ
jgi:hypothetical protein